MLGLIQNTVTLSAILLLAALGGLMSERAGIINIALEGKMLTAACVGATVSSISGQAVSGIFAGILAAVFLSLIHLFLTTKLEIDQIVSGMVINMSAIGITDYTARQFNLGNKKVPEMPLMFFVILGLFLAISLSYYFAKHRGGWQHLAVGYDPEKAREIGLNVPKIRFQALVFTGIFAGLSGLLMMFNSGAFTNNMTAGRGFIALAALIVGGWRPLATLAACVIFALADAMQTQFQGITIGGAVWPPAVWQSLPYLLTILAMMFLVAKTKAPAGLGKI